MASSGTCASRYGRIFGVMTLAPKEAEVVDSVPPCYFGGNLPAHSAQFIIAYGSEELSELKRQSHEFAAVWGAQGLPGELIEGG